jgi:hypothetical protein
MRRKCKKCGRVRAESRFYDNSRRVKADGTVVVYRSTQCRDCRNEYQRQWREGFLATDPVLFKTMTSKYDDNYRRSEHGRQIVVTRARARARALAKLKAAHADEFRQVYKRELKKARAEG